MIWTFRKHLASVVALKGSPPRCNPSKMWLSSRPLAKWPMSFSENPHESISRCSNVLLKRRLRVSQTWVGVDADDECAEENTQGFAPYSTSY